MSSKNMYGGRRFAEHTRIAGGGHTCLRQRLHTVPGSTFDDNLRKFVRETRQRGGIPVLFNSVVRRSFVESKTAVEDDDKRDNSSKGLVEGDALVDTHGDYLVSPRKVAEEMNVPFIDANKI